MKIIINDSSYDKLRDLIREGADSKSEAIMEVLPKDVLIQIFQNMKIHGVDASKLTDMEYEFNDNPFRRGAYVRIHFNNGLLMVIEEVDNGFEVKIGENTGWTGGLEGWAVQYTFVMPELSLKAFIEGLNHARKHQQYCLVSRYGTGTVHEIIMTGTEADFIKYAKENGYEVERNSYTGRLCFYNYSLPQWDDRRTLYVVALTPQQIKNIQQYK